MNTPETNYCKDCGCEQPIENFGFRNGSPNRYCREHTNQRQKIYCEKRNTPNTYINTKEKNEVFEVLLAIGWKFNEENNIWWKDGIKDSNGKFHFEMETKIRKPIKKYKTRDNQRYRNIITTETINQMIELRKLKKSYNEISELLNISPRKVIKYTKFLAIPNINIKFHEEEVQRIKEMRQKGFKLFDIAFEFKTSMASIRKYLKE